VDKVSAQQTAKPTIFEDRRELALLMLLLNYCTSLQNAEKELWVATWQKNSSGTIFWWL
jgi:hypothetical protein